MTTRLVSIDQIAAGPKTEARHMLVCAMYAVAVYKSGEQGPVLKVRQIADAAGGDVFEPINGLEAGLADGLRMAIWKHPVHVEVVNG